MNKTMGIYVHIPFCVKKCNYCDFNSYANCLFKEQAYFDALFSEIRKKGKKYEGVLCDTVYIGGGTPTAVKSENIEKLVRELKENFNVEISNKYVSFTKTVNVKGINDEKYDDSYWDESGKIMETDVFDHVWIDETFRSFEPQDVDNDGIYEIVCSQYASLGEYSSCIGYASTTLKYNTEIKQFEIIRANFYPYSK